MKSTQLLSIVFSLIMFTGVTAGSVAFAESDDIIDSFEDCVEAGYPIMESFPEQCKTDDGTVFVNNDRHGLGDRLEKFCEMTDEEKRQLFADHPRLEQFSERLLNYCEMSENERENAIDKLIEEHGDSIRAELREYKDDMYDKYSNEGHGNFKDHFAMYCDMTAEERAEKMKAKHDDLPDDLRADMARYCEMSEDEQDSFRDIMMDRMDDMHDKMSDHMDYKKDMREHLDGYCEMSDEDKRAFVAENDKAEDHVEKMNRYCTLTDETDRMSFIEEHKDEYMKHMKVQMHGTMTDHMDYDRLCAMAETDRALEITDVAKLDRISDWCEMTPEEREDYKEEHHGNKMHDFDGMSDKAKHNMSDVAKTKLSENSDRLKAMIMDKHDISDERHDEIRMKYEEKHGDLDERKSELKIKFENHMRTMKIEMSDERKSSIHDRVAEMKAFKAEFHEKSAEMTDEEKQELRSEFIEQAKDMQLAWVTPRTQMTAGIDSAEVECREGFSLVMKASNGVAMCLKADSALKMIDRGIVVPAN